MTSVQLPDPTFHKWPGTATEEYTTARRALLEKEFALVNQQEEVAAQRRALPLGPIMPTYTFEEGSADLDTSSATRQTTLAELTKKSRNKTLIVQHFMMDEGDVDACSGCTMMTDSLNGIAKHLAQRFTLVIIAKAPLPIFRAWAKKRGWKDVRLLSSDGNTFNKDMGVESPDWFREMKQGPGLSVFKYEGAGDGEEGKVRFVYQTTPHFGKETAHILTGMDSLTLSWQLFDITPEGRGGFIPSNEYVDDCSGVIS
ncbi:DUF899-domain-containing protein [Amniculicola lignicola CBS 123094]|uniref:DUF899-domain-containing protein n=1 Tax=Amniculicola lignicola CBS 123094 TaxID=1392246 RepID=A0A6A5X0I6_9PLEO|nr:DUF899-domain-containing protein [Amniculicola lignicola CBS 123094]